MSTVPDLSQPRAASRDRLFVRTLRKPTGSVAAVMLVAVVAIAIAAPLIAPAGPVAATLADVLAPPSAEHPLGGDAAGRDLLARLVFGAQTSLLGAALATGIAMLIGIPTGLLAGYYGTWFDSAVSWTASLVMAMPGIVILIAFRAAVSPSIWIAMTVFGVLLAPAYFFLVRSGVSAVRNELYVDAARVAGLGDARIVARHILSVVRGPILIQTGMILSIGLVIQAGLEFLGLGDRSLPSWGATLNEGFSNIYRAPQLVLWPGLALGVTTAALILLVSAVRDTLEGRARTSWRGVPTSGPDTPAEPVAGPARTERGSLLQVGGLRVAYPDKGSPIVVVDDVTIDVAPGEVVGLVGESGSGKTQTALAVLGLLPEGGRVLTGTISIDGVVTTLQERRELLGRRIGYVPQEPMSNLDPNFTIGSQLVEPLRIAGASRQDARRRALELLERVGIRDPERVYASYPHQISGGMAQRVLIAGAVSTEPELLIADEPTTALDVTVQADILDLLRDLQQERAMGLLIVTHNLGVVADLCDRVYVMRSGRIVETNTASELFAHPEHEYTKVLLDSTLEGKPARKELDDAAVA